METNTSTTVITESKVAFNIKKFGFLNIKGSVADFKGNVVFDENNLENAHFDVSVSTVTINTGNPKRDEHLKSNDFFYVKEFPTISFKSSEIKKDKGLFLANGKLTMLKTTHDILITFKYENGALKGSFSLNRLDYELGSKFPSFIVGKNVEIAINVKLK